MRENKRESKTKLTLRVRLRTACAGDKRVRYRNIKMKKRVR
mgnify:CR=1 FL=1